MQTERSAGSAEPMLLARLDRCELVADFGGGAISGGSQRSYSWRILLEGFPLEWQAPASQRTRSLFEFGSRLRHNPGQSTLANRPIWDSPMLSEAIRSSANVRALLVAVGLAAGLGAGPAFAEDEPHQEAAAPETDNAEARLPPARITEHEIALDGTSLRFTATAGAVPLSDAEGRLEAEIAFTAYTRDGAEPAERPVTFVVNGGPGAASAYLQLGAVGPWVLAFDPERIVPSAAPTLADNPDTWLAFTDLVFLDPVGAGFSRLIGEQDRVRDRYLSIDGDIEALADAVLHWTVANRRVASPNISSARATAASADRCSRRRS